MDVLGNYVKLALELGLSIRPHIRTFSLRHLIYFFYVCLGLNNGRTDRLRLRGLLLVRQSYINNHQQRRGQRRGRLRRGLANTESRFPSKCESRESSISNLAAIA